MPEPKQAWTEFIQGIFRDDDGAPSFSRIVSFIFLMGMLAMDLAEYFQTGKKPEVGELVAQTGSGSVPYLINRAHGAFVDSFVGDPKPLEPTKAEPKAPEERAQ